jgi:hypothetical protein
MLDCSAPEFEVSASGGGPFMSIRAHAAFRVALEPTSVPAIDASRDVDVAGGEDADPKGLGTVSPAEPRREAATEAPLPEASPVVGLLVGECTATCHPTLSGRVRVGFVDTHGAHRESWLATLHGLAVRAHDRVLISQPGNWHEPLVIGVIAGLTARPSASGPLARQLELLPDESLTIVDSAGTPLIEVTPGEAGPRLQLLSSQIDIDVAGALRLRAESIELCASAGSATVTASEDVIVRGEKVRLN